jgi:hypothetical protein
MQSISQINIYSVSGSYSRSLYRLLLLHRADELAQGVPGTGFLARRRSSMATATTLKPGTVELMRHLPGTRSKYFVSAPSFMVIAFRYTGGSKNAARVVSNHTTWVSSFA